MLEATLFGYEKGAFTGALAAHAGKFEQAQGGTLLLDEISEMDLGLQAKILRVLQEREVERLGSSRTIEPRRARDRDLEPRPAGGGARRRASAPISTTGSMSCRCGCPPLRERRGDILPLARRAIQACARGGQAALSLSAEAERKLLQHDWPGNARELTNIVQRAAWLATGGSIDAADLDTGSRRGRRCAVGGRCRGRCRRGGRRAAAECRTRHGSQGTRARVDPGDAARHGRQPQAHRRAARHQPAHAAPQAAAVQGGRRQRAARCTINNSRRSEP